MPILGRQVAALLSCHRSARLLGSAALLSLIVGSGGALAREVTVSGAQMPRFGRILLKFDQPTRIQTRVTNGVLVVSFAAPAKVLAERLAAELAPYVSSVRRDPDDTGLRLALVGPVKPNVLEAGERTYIDLLPPNWVGLPPSLPPEVVAELAERARAAEEKLREEAQRRAEPTRPVMLRLAELPTLTRFVFEPPAGIGMRVKETPDGVEATFDGALVLDERGEKPKMAAGVKAFTATAGDKSLTVKVAAAQGFQPRAFTEEGTIVIDLARPEALKKQGLPEPKAPTRPAEAAAAKPAADGHDAPSGTPPAAAAVASPAAPAAPVAPTRAAQAAPVPAQPADAPAAPGALPPGKVVPVAEASQDALTLTFPFRSRTAAAAFEIPGGLELVFETPDRLQPIDVPEAARSLVDVRDIKQTERVAIVRLALAEARTMRFAPDGNGWRLILGGRDATPPDALKVARGADDLGNAIVTVALPGASGAYWVDSGPGGERVAVVTAFGQPQGLPKAMGFVEFALPASLQGLAVLARADDLTVALGSNGVSISRRSGLSLSPSTLSNGGASRHDNLVLDRDEWLRNQSGDVLQHYNELILATTTAAKAGRGEARYREAQLLVANGMNEEAAGVLALARAEDSTLSRRRDVMLLSGVAALRAGRIKDAQTALGADVLADDPEAILWRAMLDAKQKQWARAAAGFRRSAPIVARYSDDLAGAIRLAAFQTAIASNEIGVAEVELGALDQLPSDVVPSGIHDLARARLEEAAGHNASALKSYAKLVEDGDQRIWAEATLRSVALAVRTGDRSLSQDEAIKKLDVLSAAWRGDEIELGTIVELSRLYAKAERWRDVFNMMRRASRSFPTSDLTRVLHDETALVFEKLFLGSLGHNLEPVEALGLYFDFRELAPVGRRGDEIVRRLADRLVELDLLDQAADLLQHQVDKRLTGVARATVAARLSAVYLLNGKPALALAALQSTRLSGLPEEVRQFRLLLEAQTQAEMSRVDLALEALEGESDPAFARQRMSILWGARRWREAGEAAESLVGLRWQGKEPLSARDRSDVVRAAIAYSLANETLAIGRLRSKFGPKMADSPDASVFSDIIQPNSPQTREFREAALKASKGDNLRELLAQWKVQHPGTVAEPTSAGVAAAAPDGKPRPEQQAQGSGAGAPPG